MPRLLHDAGARLLLTCLAAAPLCLPGGVRADGGWITLLHTNDIHGGYAAREAQWLDTHPLVGGFLSLSGVVEAARREHPVVLLDAGDLMSGNPLTVVDYHGVMGGGAMAFMNAMGYDAMELGNHEFDSGRPELEALLEMAAFPVLSANLRLEGGERLFAPAAHIVIERGGYRIAIFGLILDDLAGVVAAEPIRGLRVEPMVTAARREVRELDPRSDLLIALVHAGLDDCRALARAVEGIDVIVAGHDHRRTRRPILEHGALIIETGNSLANVGRLDLRVAFDQVEDYRYELQLLEESNAASASAAVRRVFEECDAAVQAEYGAEIATLVRPFKRAAREESNVGDWVADVLREAAAADFALTNSSGLRVDLGAGPLTRLDLHELMPFRNLLSTFRCTGRELELFARHNAARVLGNGSLVQVSGLSFAYDEQGGIHDLRVGGEPVAEGRTYTGATSDFVLFSQAEKYLGFVPAERERTTVYLTDLLGETAARQGRIDARVEGRVRRLAGVLEVGQPMSGTE